MTWRKLSSQIISKGASYKATGAVKSLADLHQARTVHDSQFFTPSTVSRLIWEIIGAYTLGQNFDRHIPIFDNSIGSGSLVDGAHPDKHYIYGFDVDSVAVETLSQDLENSGFHHEVGTGSMVETRARGMGIAIVNPPFSLNFSSPTLEPFECTCFGKYGINSHAISHEYALEQALNASQCVFAVLPRDYAHRLKNDRLAALIDLPKNAFKCENATVHTSIAIFNSSKVLGLPLKMSSDTIDLAMVISKLTPLDQGKFSARFHHYSIQPGTKVITTPNTGIKTVRVYRSKQKVRLAFECGLTEAKVLNALYGDFINHREVKHRIPEEFKFCGEGRLHLPFYFTRDNPMDPLRELCEIIQGQGGKPEVCNQLINYIRKKERKYKIQKAGFARWIQAETTLDDTAEVKMSFVADPRQFPAVIIKQGEILNILERNGVEWLVQRKDGSKVFCIREKVEQNCSIRTGDVKWQRIGSSHAERCPERARQVTKACEETEAFKLCSWDYQSEDLVDALIAPDGLLISAEQGLGKTRAAYGIALATPSSHSLIITLPQLKDQFLKEASDNGIKVHSIDRPEDLSNLGKINLITISRLRCKLSKRSKRSYAKAMRNRFGTIILDECDLLRNTNTAQSRCINQLGGVRKYGLSGTPIANYPRNIMGLGQWVFGHGNVIQPYSARAPYPEAGALQNCTYAQRGIDRFESQFTHLVWVTHEFREEGQKGAKREIPAIRNLNDFRAYASRLMIRRLREEPMVAKYFPKIEIKKTTHTIKWNNAHLAHYLDVSEDFKNWFQTAIGGSGKNVSLIALLARIGAVISACNHPQFPTKNSAAYLGVNNKEEKLFQLINECTDRGEKSIIFLHSPKQAERLAVRAKEAGLESILLTGDIDQRVRTHDLNERFRNGNCSVCFATFGVARYGLNIPESNNVIFYSRCWSNTDESQAIFRVLRPQQSSDVNIHYLHHEGSIDLYQGQMVEYKKDAALSGLDFAEPTKDTASFLHMDHILGEYCQNLKDLYSVETTHELRELLRAS